MEAWIWNKVEEEFIRFAYCACHIVQVDVCRGAYSKTTCRLVCSYAVIKSSCLSPKVIDGALGMSKVDI